MENRPVLRVQAVRIMREFEERFLNWRLEAYFPLYMKVPHILQIDWWQIVEENPIYPKNLMITHYPNRMAPVEARQDPNFQAIMKDAETSFSGKVEAIWMAAYELIESFKKDPVDENIGSIPKPDSSPVVHLEGYIFSEDEQGKYDAWFDKSAKEAFIPLLMRLPGLREYARYRLVEVDPTGLKAIQMTKRPVTYPPRLSSLTFDDVTAFENYEKSLELAAFKRAIEAPFPFGLLYQWYVQYQVVRSYTK